jgi:DNA-binding SARP family transcriptional activator
MLEGASPRFSAQSLAGTAIVRLRLIGQMEALTCNDENVLPPGRKTRALLAIVALSSPRPALRGRLAELLWGRRPEEQARASLRQEIHRLLEALAPAGPGVLQVTRDHISLRPGAVWIDVEAVVQASVGEPTALSLLDGDLLEDLDGIEPSFDAWLSTERERLSDRGRMLAEALLREQLEPEAAIEAAQRLLQIDRAHEGAWRALMRGHAARGERGLAIQAYDRCRAALGDLLDASPSAETQALLTEIRGPTGGQTPPRSSPQLDAEPSREAHAESATDPHAVPSNRTGPRVGIMPLRPIGMVGEEATLAPGLAEEITTALTRFPWLSVVTPNSLARFSTELRDEVLIRRTFGIDYLLDGSVQLVRRRFRITTRLLDLRSGNQVVWARRFDRDTSDLLALQEDIAAEVVAQIDQVILPLEAKYSAARQAGDATAYDLMLRAIPPIGRLDQAPFMQAGDDLARAIALEPGCAAAYAWRAYWQMILVSQGWTDEPAAMADDAAQNVERAIMLDQLDARSLTIAGHVRAFLQRRPHDGLALHERALSLNPNLAMAWALSGLAYAYLGEPAEAERRINRYKQLSPLDPHAIFFDAGFALIHLLRRDYTAAVEVARAVSEMNPAFTAIYKPYLAALGHLGRHQEAAIVRRRLLARMPNFGIAQFMSTTPLERATDRELYAEGLRIAGIPERSQHAIATGTGRATQSVS